MGGRSTSLRNSRQKSSSTATSDCQRNYTTGQHETFIQQRRFNTEQHETATRQRNPNAGKQHYETDIRQRSVNAIQRGTNATKREKCYDPRDSTLKFVDQEDELDFLCDDFKSLRALMSCGHAVTPMSLTNWCRRLLDQGKNKFVCGVYSCDAVWSYEEVCKMALLTPKEKEYFEQKMFNNAKKYLNIKPCPGCKSRVMRDDPNNLSVECTVCTAERKSQFLFCWQCLREWKGPYPHTDGCENEGCRNLIETLRQCPDIIFESVKEVTGCPSIRACPTCGQLVEHNKTKCKNIVCPQCEVEFCFVCLKLTKDCQRADPESWYRVCSSGVAPRQTSIPVRKTE
ncbi:uncharacterized protein LOC108902202 [Lates calcarifer]|uniref:Uncharacterized protein LOC108902202 n=1 Tax=Lates calcarifer TaxID=8187 RepID=A0A4W6CN23_LATCA|nr:uncharacterized protein LOC108902202 [Lates calcarifer]